MLEWSPICIWRMCKFLKEWIEVIKACNNFKIVSMQDNIYNEWTWMWSGFDYCDWGMLIAMDIILISHNIPRYLIEVSMNDWEVTSNKCNLILCCNQLQVFSFISRIAVTWQGSFLSGLELNLIRKNTKDESGWHWVKVMEFSWNLNNE